MDVVRAIRRCSCAATKSGGVALIDPIRAAWSASEEGPKPHGRIMGMVPLSR
jgi:hypothetical protein